MIEVIIKLGDTLGVPFDKWHGKLVERMQQAGIPADEYGRVAHGSIFRLEGKFGEHIYRWYPEGVNPNGS